MEVTYHGHTFRTRRCYADYDSFKSDSGNFAAAEFARIAAVMRAVAFSRVYPSEDAMISAGMALKFPGYGLTTIEAGPLALFSAEIPGTSEHRCVVFLRAGSRYRLVDDFTFVITEAPFVDVRLEGRQLSYLDIDDRVVLAHPLHGPLALL